MFLPCKKSGNRGESETAVKSRTHGRSAPEAHTTDVAVLAARVEALSRQVEELSRLVESLLARRSSGDSAEKTLGPAAEMTMQERSVSATAGSTGPHESGETACQRQQGRDPDGGSRGSGAAGLRQRPHPRSWPDRSALAAISGSGSTVSFVQPITLTTPGQPSLPHVQNIRGRYRFRLNIDAEPAMLTCRFTDSWRPAR